MELIHILLIFSTDFLSVMPVTGKPNPPTDIRIDVIDNKANLSWIIPTDQGVQWSRIYLYDSKSRQISLTNRIYKDLRFPECSFMITSPNIQMCSKYSVSIQYLSSQHNSDISTHIFWMTNELEPPRNVTIQVIDNIAKISWTITTNQEVNTSLISLFTSNGTKVAIDSSNNFKYLKYPVTSYDIVNLTLCSEYVVKIEYLSRGVWSGITEQKFWMTNNIFTTDINDSVVVSWTTGMAEEFYVMAPFYSNVIYEVQYNIIGNSEGGKYIFDRTPKNVSAIDITVINVSKTDAGIYRAQGYNKIVDGCCLLIVTSKPINTTLNLQPKHPFVGDNITLTCLSTIQRWPVGYGTSHLSYQFHGINTRGAIDNNKLTINTLTMSDKGTIIKCQATDDQGKVSNMSRTVTLDPYYGPDDVILEPQNTVINVTEGSNLGPIHCNATCYPKCKYQWKQNFTSRFASVENRFVSNDNHILTVLDINRRQAGTFRCRVDHRYADKKGRTDLTVNVQYSSKIIGMWLRNNDKTSAVANGTTYNFSEEKNITMTLRIESNPDSQLILRSSFLKTYQLNYSKSATDCKSKLPSLKCEDSGIYQIQASNGIPYGDNITVNFKIYCKPRNVTTSLRKIGTTVKKREYIELYVVSFPAPTVEWIRSTGFHWTVTKYGHDYKYKINSTIHIKTADDFGEYGIRICNRGEQLGCVKETITLTAEDRPEAPYNVSSETTTFGSVNLSWIAGFNGGDTQTFSVQFKTTDEDKWETKIVHTNETMTGSRVYFSLNQLKPDTSYQVLVVSANKHGKRNVSLEFKTKVEPTLSLPSSASVSPLSIGIGCGIAVLVLTIILLVFIIRRKKTSKTESKECSVLYAEVDKEQQKSERRKPVKEDGDEPANGEYASVVKSKSKKVHYKEDTIETENNEYAIVDKSNKDYTENESVYANQDDEQLLPHKPLEAQSSGRNTNQDGLTYIEVSFTSNQSDRRPIIGAESKTDYVDIDFTRKADPLPDDSD